MVWSVFTAVEPPVSNHPKYKDLVVAYGRWSLRRFSPWGSLLRRSPCSDEQSVQLFHSNVGHMRAVLVYMLLALCSSLKCYMYFYLHEPFCLKSRSEL